MSLPDAETLARWEHIAMTDADAARRFFARAQIRRRTPKRIRRAQKQQRREAESAWLLQDAQRRRMMRSWDECTDPYVAQLNNALADIGYQAQRRSILSNSSCNIFGSFYRESPHRGAEPERSYVSLLYSELRSW